MDETEIETDPSLVTFGSIIALADYHNQNAYVFSDGFLKTSLVLKNLVDKKQTYTITYYLYSSDKQLGSLENNSFYNCLFQVYPKISDTNKSQILEKCEELDKGKTIEVQAQMQTEQAQEYNYQDRYRVDDIKEKLNQLLNEYKYNIDTYEKTKVQKLSYNQPFLMMHLASGRFLACHEVESQFESQNYQLRLDDITSDASVFTVLPAYTFQKDGDQVVYLFQILNKDVNAGEMCTITRAIPILNKITYLNCSSMDISKIKENQSKQSKSKSKNQQPKPDYGKVFKREINASVQESHSWKVIKFSSYIPETSKYLVAGDCIWLHHSEAEACLSGQRIVSAVDKQSFSLPDFTQWLSLSNLEVKVKTYSDQEAGQDSQSEGYNGSINGLWQIEGSDFNQGGYVQFERSYRFRHLTSGYYLQVIKNPLTLKIGAKLNKKDKFLFSLTDQNDRSTLFEFIELKTMTKDKFVKPGAYIYLLNVQYKQCVDFFKIDKGYRWLLKPENEKTEHAVFKIHKASRNEIWEINFLLSSFRALSKFLIMLQSPKYPGPTQAQSKKNFASKIQRATICVSNLDDFVNSRDYCTTIDQQYGQRNSGRQTLLKEQFYIDLMVLLLNRLITKGELELWQRRQEILNNKKNNQNLEFGSDDDEDQELQEGNEFDRTEALTRHQTLLYVGTKIALCNQVYKFLESVCKNNQDNQLYLFELIPYFQLHCKYLSQATTNIIDIISTNLTLLIKLSEGVKIDIVETKEDAQKNVDAQQINILINLFEEPQNINGTTQMIPNVIDGHMIPFNQHDKISQKPINLINYFINLIWDEQAYLNSDYLKFLRSLCRYQHEPIAINQENIFKLYKKNNDNRPKLGVETKAEESKQNDGTVRLMSKAGSLIIPSECTDGSGNAKKQYIKEQLTFFSEVSFGRNFLWKKELGAQFEKSFLFRNIWNKNPTDEAYLWLQPCFAKIASTLYIDQEPLMEKKVPVYCQLFADCDKPEDLRLFKQNYQELNTYNDLVKNMLEYFQSEIYNPLYNELQISNPDQKIGKDILKDELISDSTSLLFLIIRLDLFQVLQYSLDSKSKPAKPARDIYSQLLKTLLYTFQYEKFELNFVKAHVLTLNEQIIKAKETKSQKRQLLLPMKINIGGTSKPEEAKEDVMAINEQYLYNNQLMRGYIKFSSRLAGYNYMEPKHVHNERQVKLNICDILEGLLNLRHNFMMLNTLVFFKHYIVNGVHEEDNDYLLKIKLQGMVKDQGDKRLNIDTITSIERKELIVKRILQIHQKGLLPNIAQTGLKNVDEPTQESNTPFSALSNIKNISLFKQQEIKNFKNYIAELKLQGIPEILDLDQYLSIAQGDPDPFTSPIASLLPTLLNSFLIISDKELEKRCLGVIMRLFNQQLEFKNNILGMQVIFDKEKTLLYKYLRENLKLLQKHVDRLDDWICNFEQNVRVESLQLMECLQIVENISNGMYQNIGIKDDGIITFESEKIEDDKQTLLANLQSQIPILNLIRAIMPYFHEYILDAEFQVEKKYLLIKLLRSSFKLLRNFCWQNQENQLKLFEFLGVITSHLQFDLGQLDLICTIYFNNKHLLLQNVDSNLIRMICGLVEREGRQEIFMETLDSLIIYQNNYIFDNQLLIANAILPSEINDKTIKTLYADGSSNKEIRFYFDDVVYVTKDDVFKKLQEVDFKDTFRDEPFRYHQKLLNLLLQTSFLNQERRKFKVSLALPQVKILLSTRTIDGKRLAIKEVLEEDYKDNFNILVSKLKKYFGAEYLLQLLRQKDRLLVTDLTQSMVKVKGQKPSETQVIDNEDHKSGFAILKPILIELLRQVHVSSERGALQNSQLFECQVSVGMLFEMEFKRVEQLQEAPQLTKEYVDYCFEGLLPFAICYFERFLRRFLETQQSEEERKDLSMMEKFTSKLLSKMIKFSQGLSPFVEDQDRALLLLKVYFYFPCQQFETIKECLHHQDEQHRDDFVQAAHQIERLCMGLSIEQYMNYQENRENWRQLNTEEKTEFELKEEKREKKKQKKLQKLASAQKRTNMSKDKFSIDLDFNESEGLLKGYDSKHSQKLEKFWKVFVDQLVGNQLFEDWKKEETTRIANAIFSIQKLFNPQHTKNVTNVPDVKTVSMKLIHFLKVAFNDSRCKGTVETLLMILKTMVEKEDNREMKVKMQNLFDSLGATQMVLEVLSENTKFLDKKMIMNFLEFINTLLEGGNIKVQNTMYKFMMNYSQSEMIFYKVFIVIRKQIENIENRKNNSKELQVNNTASIDHQEEQEDLMLMNLVLEFLQNSVEGHYLVMQNYLRSQINSRNNYDLIIGVADLFKTYYYEACSKANYENMIRCLDTLNELVQGPCLENQLAVSESRFFEIAADLFSLKSKSSGQKDKNNESQLLPWMVTRLQNKVLMLLLSLLEGREINHSNTVLKRIMRNLPLPILEYHLAKIYKKYKSIYQDNYIIECLQHLKLDPLTLSDRDIKKLPPKYFETILQNGFLLFFLISYYIECDPTIQSPIVQLHKQFKKSILVTNNDNIAAQVFKESVLGQLLDFLRSLLDSFYSIFTSFTQLAVGAASQFNNPTTVEDIPEEERQKIKAEKQRKLLKESVDFYMRNSAHIDVMHGDKLEVVYFILLPFTSYLPKDKKLVFHDTVDRSTTQAKVQGLFNEADNLIEVCQHEEFLKLFFQKQKFLALFTTYFLLWKEFAWLLTLFLNIFIIFSFNAYNGDRVNNYIFFDLDTYTLDETKSIITLIGVVMVCCSLFVMVYILLKNLPIIIKRSWRQPAIFEDQKNQNIIFWSINKAFKIINIFLSIFSEIEIMYYIAYGTFAILGIFQPLFFIFHLSEILFRYPTLKNIILSVWQPRHQLILTFILLLILIYYFSIIAYMTISEQFKGNCDTLLYCFLICIDQTFQGSIGGWIDGGTGNPNVTVMYGIGRFFYDNISNIGLAIIMLNIVGGIIIDTFGSLREEENAKLADKVNNCFICGNLAATFERNQSENSTGFDEHIKINHYMWNYLFFIAYLKNKDETEFSGTESFVYSKLQEDDLCWVPFNQARELHSMESSEQQGEAEIIASMQEKIMQVQDKLSEVSKILKVNYKNK